MRGNQDMSRKATLRAGGQRTRAPSTLAPPCGCAPRRPAQDSETAGQRTNEVASGTN